VARTGGMPRESGYQQHMLSCMMSFPYMTRNESFDITNDQVIYCHECRQMPAGAQPLVAAMWSVVTPASTVVEPACWPLSKPALQVCLSRTCTLLPLHFTAAVALAVALHLTSVPVNSKASLQASGWLATVSQALTKSH